MPRPAVGDTLRANQLTTGIQQGDMSEMHTFRRFTLALTLAAIAALAVLGAVVWADDGTPPSPPPEHGMHAMGVIKDVNATDKTFSVQPLFGHSDAQTFYTDTNTKYFMLTKPDASFADLAQGMRVEVEAHKDSASGHDIADRVTVIPPPPAAMGKVIKVTNTSTETSFDIQVGRRNSRTITVDTHTQFILPNNTAGAFSDLKVGDQVEVWSATHANADDDTPAPILATVVRILHHAPPPPTTRPFNEVGKIADLDKTAKTFTLVVTPRQGDVKKFAVKYSDTTQILPPTADPHGLLDDMTVRVVGTMTPSSSTSTPATVNARLIIVMPNHPDD